MKDYQQESATKKPKQSRQQSLHRHGQQPMVSRELESVMPGQSSLSSQQTALPSSAVVQTKLTVNEPDDQYEQEAERVADTVMRMPLPMVAPPPLTGPPPLANPLHTLRRRASERNNSDERRKPPGSGPSLMRVPTYPSMDISSMMHIPPVQALLIARVHADRAEAYEASRAVSPALESRIEGMNGSGSPLPDSERNFFESRMGADFSGVRVHTNNNAVQTSRDINARAFTTGNNIAFNSGEYQPGTTAGRHLLAHELTHTIQQGGAAQLKRAVEPQEGAEGSSDRRIEEQKVTLPDENSLADSLAIGSEANEGTVARSPEQPGGTKSSKGGAPPKEVISLQDATFKPSAAFDEYFEQNEGASAEVEASLGTLAKGFITVEKSGDGYQTKGGQARAIALSHPGLAALAGAGVKPVLAVKIQGNSINGFLSIGTPGQAVADISKLVNWIKDNPEAMGWLGLDLKNFPSTSNELAGGVLNFKVENFNFKLGGYLEGSGSFSLENTLASFEANADIKVEGITNSKLELSGDSSGKLKGSVNIPITLDKFSGELNAAYDNGIVEIKGKAGYETEKLSGEVELIVTDEATASSVAQQQLGADKIIQSGQAAAGGAGGQAKDGPRAMAGWGTLNFRFTEWLTGQAQVIVDNKGQITVVGEIAPPAEVEIFPQKDYIKELFKVEVRAQYGVPLVANVFLFGNVGMEAVAKIGPAKLYNIKLDGTYSTDPNVLNDFSLQGTLNMSAFAGLRLTVEGGAGLEVLDHDVKAGIGINAMGGVKGYVEATPTIGYREQAAPSEGKEGEFYIKGHMELAAQPFLQLGGELFVELDSPWWSPAGDHKWPWDLGSLEYPLPGEFGIGADVDYTIGSGEMPEIQFGQVDFNAEKFMSDLVNDKVPPKSNQAEQEGKWEEGSTSGAGEVEATVTDTQGGPTEDATTGGKQEEGVGKVPSPDIEQQWQAGLKTLGDLAEKSQEEPLTKGEIESALKSSGFDNVRLEPAGEDFSVYVSMGDLSNEKKPAVIKAKAKGEGEEGENAEFTKEERDAGLAAFETEEQKYAENGTIGKADAQKTAKDVKQKHSVFKSITVVDGGDSWDYKYVFRNETVDTSTEKPDKDLDEALSNAKKLISQEEATLQTELKWYQQAQAEARKKLEQLKGHDVSQLRGEWGKYDQKLDTGQRALKSWKPSLNALKERLQDAIEVAQDIELGELVLEDLKQIIKEASELRLTISEIKRPQTPPEPEEEHESAQPIPSLEEQRDVMARDAIIARGGGGSQVKQLGSHKGVSYADLTVGELQTLEKEGDTVEKKKARTALKIIKQADAKRQKYGGKS